MNDQALTCHFITGVSALEERDPGRVLVLGRDWIGLELADRLSRDGLHVVLVGQDQSGSPLPGVTCMPSATLEEIRGFIGDFTALLRTGEGLVRERVAAVIAADPARRVPSFARYGLSPSDRVLSLSDLEERLQEGVSLGDPRGIWLHVAFLSGLKDESHPAVFSRVLDALDLISQTPNAQTYVFANNLKVAGPGLEKRFRESRQRGTLYFKFEQDVLTFASEEDALALIFPDPLLESELVLYPDVLVLDEVLLPPLSMEPLLNAIPSSPAFEPFLQPESVRFAGVETPKAGIYAVGPSRGIFAEDQIRGDIDAVAAALKRSLLVTDRTGWAAPQVDPNLCTMCLTCVRLCPHGAMSFAERPGADPISCVRCGICAAECPMAAITLAPPDRARGTVAGETSSTAASKPITAFLCARSAMDAFAAIDLALKQNVTVTQVPCAGSVSVMQILMALGNGASGVLVAGCYKGNCASIYGTALAQERCAQIHGLLEEAGVPPSRVVFTSCASNGPARLAAALRELQTAGQV